MMSSSSSFKSVLLSTPLLLLLRFIPSSSAAILSYPPPKFETTVYTLTGAKTYLAQTAVFGKELSSNRTYNANLWLPPPDDMDFCNYPKPLENVTKADMVFLDTAPMALLVSRGNCSFDDKARVALELKNQLLSNLQFLFVMNNNQTDPNELVIMSTSASGYSKDLLDDMSYMLVSKTSGDAILQHIHTYAEATSQSPYLIGSDNNSSNSNWLFITAFRQYAPSSKNWNNGRNPARRTFRWLRFVLFSLLIISPCARAVYLWYSAGGRVMFRRTEDGRITGLMYVRPMPYWFASGQATNNNNNGDDDDPGNCNLTEQQVLELPEIEFKPGREDDDDDDNNKDDETKTQGESDDDIAGSSSSLSSSSPPVVVVDEEQAVPDVVEQQQQAPSVVRPVGNTSDNMNQTSTTTISHSTTDFVPSSEVSVSPTTTSSSDDVVVVIAAAPPEENDSDTKEVRPHQCETQIRTSCTMCSICIDDFEEGEKIRVLPRCGHGYHLECLKPWLTERQGCCPLCKTPVLGPEPSTSSSSEDGQQEDDVSSSSTAINTAPAAPITNETSSNTGGRGSTITTTTATDNNSNSECPA
uniref:RING-type domain-containing protein n=1 Tax=Grammatophora oceanica TaxID=210454 RepID=A0A7S1Y311_9STRA|mmetsp:Transcript_14355/g.21037  ORF Transcript_14355/g.21037 Transcript_14355/m.21037 type:complete len:583 (+) Transcript_14355:184-1932(+)|eukprot:CAMPEP_0194063496 /NCGR_PEP_ID=MMETSP0009_2-20130614/80492_1 /TAXON_ID=210454 /ORGANISM="Grammatophora oceanica, Strain CCMP 410" /LENGTH=582 /DNA_ID=CAMNT_0038715635 /DNA_START=125 /DNA_END=1873 /DNA_ORIENTATION=+